MHGVTLANALRLVLAFLDFPRLSKFSEARQNWGCVQFWKSTLTKIKPPKNWISANSLFDTYASGKPLKKLFGRILCW